MKKFIIIFALSIGVASFANTTNAQNVNININIGNQPSWGPVGYDYVNYYYFPDIDCYYDINQEMFVYYNRGHWMTARYLPYRYRNYDLYVLHKIVLSDARPWRYNHSHRSQYARYKGYRGQTVIRDSRDNRYRSSRNNNVTWYSSSRDNNHRPSVVSNARPSNTGRPSAVNSTRPTSNTSRPNVNNGRPETTTRPGNNSQSTRPSRVENNNRNKDSNTTTNNRSTVQRTSTDRSGRSSGNSASANRTPKNSSRNAQNSSAR